MKDAARIDTAREIFTKAFTEVLKGRPADSIVTAEIKNRRYMGSSDRRAVTEMIWQSFRNTAKALWYLRDSDASAEAIFDTVLAEKYNNDLAKDMPLWAKYECPQELFSDFAGKEQSLLYMNNQAETDLRINSAKADIKSIIRYFEQQDVPATALPYSPDGIRLKKRINMQAFSAFKDGLFWVQDEGSQIISRWVAENINDGARVLDLCAGAGGKTLSLYDMTRGKDVSFTACDVAFSRLKELEKRADKAGFTGINVKTLPISYEPFVTEAAESFDVVLVDAPCSGTGTWRRSPDAKWRTSITDCEKYQKMQADILPKAAKFVKKGGKLFYVTCSLRQQENENQTTIFLSNNKGFKPLDTGKIFSLPKYPKGFESNTFYTYLLPEIWHTDGFFISAFVKE